MSPAPVDIPAADREGWRVMLAGLDQATWRFGPRLEAAFAIGSLAHGGFAPAASDVDLALVLTEMDGEEARAAEDVRKSIRREIGGDLGGRLSIFWSSWTELEASSGGGRFPLADRWDLKRHGRVLEGADRRERIRLPDGETLKRLLVREGGGFMLEKLATDARNELLRQPDLLAGKGCREVTKAVLFPARFLYTAQFGEPAGNEAAALYVASAWPGPIGDLARAAYAWRTSGELAAPAEVKALLAAGVIPLHRAAIEAYRVRLDAQGEIGLARGLERWGDELAPR